MIYSNDFTIKTKGVNMYQCKYFKIQELVSSIVYKVWQEKAWMFFDDAAKKDLDLIRERYGCPITINNWLWGGTLEQCGLRSNKDKMVANKKTLYLSAHTMGKAFDLHAGNGNHRRLYNLLQEMIKNKELSYFKRLENFNNTFTYVHIDSYDTGSIIFNP